MNKIISVFADIQKGIFDRLQVLDGIAPLLLRLFLIPIFWMAGTHKIDMGTLLPFENTVAWFANPDWGLGLPFPALMAFLAGWTEILGAVFLAAGFAVRWISVPLMVTMLVAAFSAHWDNGWQAISDPGAPFANERVVESAERLSRAKEILKANANYNWLTEKGSFVVLNNGIEFAATYFLMCLTLFFTGAGRFFSLDYWIRRKYIPDE